MRERDPFPPLSPSSISARDCITQKFNAASIATENAPRNRSVSLSNALLIGLERVEERMKTFFMFKETAAGNIPGACAAAAAADPQRAH